MDVIINCLQQCLVLSSFLMILEAISCQNDEFNHFSDKSCDSWSWTLIIHYFWQKCGQHCFEWEPCEKMHVANQGGNTHLMRSGSPDVNFVCTSFRDLNSSIRIWMKLIIMDTKRYVPLVLLLLLLLHNISSQHLQAPHFTNSCIPMALKGVWALKMPSNWGWFLWLAL